MAKADIKLVPQPFVIESGVPVPSRSNVSTGEREAIASLVQAPVGSSVFLPSRDGPKSHGAVIRTLASQSGPPGWCATRKVDGGYRVWKVA